jgi:hypothetical protein
VGGEGGHKAKLSVIIETFNPCAVFVADMGGEGQQRLYQGDFPPSVFFPHLLGGGGVICCTYIHTYVPIHTLEVHSSVYLQEVAACLLYRTKT